jgi:signal transduction histidine kinase
MLLQDSPRKIQAIEFQYARWLAWIVGLGNLMWGVGLWYLDGSFADYPKFRLACVCLTFASTYYSQKRSHHWLSPSLVIFIAALLTLLASSASARLNHWPVIYLIINYAIFSFGFVLINQKFLSKLWASVFFVYSAVIWLDDPNNFPSSLSAIVYIGISLGGFLIAKGQDQIFQNLKDAEIRGLSILSSMSDGIMVLDVKTGIGNFNLAARKILNLSEETNLLSLSEFEQRFEIRNEEDQPLEIFAELFKQRRDLSTPSLDFTIRLKVASSDFRWLRWGVQPMGTFYGDPSKQEFLITMKDITEFKEKQFLIESQQEALMIQGRFTALGEMAAGIAHEINNPLAIISGRLTQMKRAITQQAPMDKLNNLIMSSQQTVDRISRIVTSMKSLSRDGQGDPFQTVQLTQLIEDLKLVCEDRLLTLNIKLTVEIPEEVVFEARQSQISQILLNLVSNSADAISEQTERWIRIQAELGEHDFKIRVTDSGNGIPEAIQKKMLQPFFTTKAIGKGTGLGLSIAARMAKAHSGDFYYDNFSTKTSFVLRLPLRQGESVPSLLKAS